MLVDRNDNTLTKQLHTAATMATRVLEQRLKPLGVNSSQFFFILKLHDDPGVSQDQLVHADSRHQSNVNREITKLVQLGFVAKQQSQTDKRRYLLRLTPAGETLYPKVKAALAAQEAALQQCLTASGVTVAPADLLLVLRQIAKLEV